MTTADLSAEGQALDYRETVDVLVDAMSVTVADSAQEQAEQMTAHLARRGLVLVRVEQPPGLARIGHETASDWFGRTEDV